MPYSSRSVLRTCAGSSHPVSSPVSFSRSDASGSRRSQSQDKTWKLSHEATTMASGRVYSPNQKEVLIGLNGRLAAYLEKVKRLEEANHKLEQQIQQATDKPAVGRDYSGHQKTIAELESQISGMKLSNPELYLEVENTRLAADGFRAKYDAELATRLTIEADIKKLKSTSGDLDMQRRCLEVEVQILSNELENLKKTHTEERGRLLQQKLRCEVNVEVNESEATQLPRDLDKLRQQHKELSDHHKKVSDACFDRKTWESTHLNIQTNLDSESLVNQRRQVSMLRKTVKELEVELEVLQNLRFAQEGVLYEVIAGYDGCLQNIQEMVGKKEEDLSKLKAEADQLSSDSRLLCHLKDLLEMEIRTYAALMDEEEDRIEDVIRPQPPINITNRQKSMSVTTKNLPVPDPSSGRQKHGGRSLFL